MATFKDSGFAELIYGRLTNAYRAYDKPFQHHIKRKGPAILLSPEAESLLEITVNNAKKNHRNTRYKIKEIK